MEEILFLTNLLNHHRDGDDDDDRDFELTSDAHFIIGHRTIVRIVDALRNEQNLLALGDPDSEDEIDNPPPPLNNEDTLSLSTHSEVNLPEELLPTSPFQLIEAELSQVIQSEDNGLSPDIPAPVLSEEIKYAE